MGEMNLRQKWLVFGKRAGLLLTACAACRGVGFWLASSWGGLLNRSRDTGPRREPLRQLFRGPSRPILRQGSVPSLLQRHGGWPAHRSLPQQTVAGPAESARKGTETLPGGKRHSWGARSGQTSRRRKRLLRLALSGFLATWIPRGRATAASPLRLCCSWPWDSLALGIAPASGQGGETGTEACPAGASQNRSRHPAARPASSRKVNSRRRKVVGQGVNRRDQQDRQQGQQSPRGQKAEERIARVRRQQNEAGDLMRNTFSSDSGRVFRVIQAVVSGSVRRESTPSASFTSASSATKAQT